MNSLQPLSLFSADIIELESRCCRPQTQHFDRKDRDTFWIIFQGRCTAFTKVLVDFQSVLTAVFGDYCSGEELSQWYLTWGSKGRRVIQTFHILSPLDVAECYISDRMEAFAMRANNSHDNDFSLLKSYLEPSLKLHKAQQSVVRRTRFHQKRHFTERRKRTIL